jgi:glycerophosphoryl diester phosphodiesterase
MTERPWDVVKSVLTDLRGSWKQLVVTNVAFKVVTLVLLAPIGGVVVRGILLVQGTTVVADKDILLLALTPLGLVGFVVIGAVALTTLAFELACLMMIGFGAVTGVDVGLIDALSHVGRTALSIVRLAMRITSGVLIRAAPFVVAGAVVFLVLLTEFDINFYLSESPPAFWLAAGLLAAVLVGALLVLVPRLVSWMLALPLLLFEGADPSAALAASAERTKGSRMRLTLLLGLWAASSVAASALALGSVRLLGFWLVAPLRDGRLELFLPAVGALVIAWVVANELVSVLTSSMFALGTVRVYETGADGQDQQVWWSAAKRFHGATARRLPRMRWLTGVGAAGVVAALTGFFLLNSIRLATDVDVIAHRGAAAVAPENTLAAFDRAIADGADWVELDVLETADGEVVVVHDRDLMRVAGVNLAIADATIDQLRNIDVGSWFASEFAAQRVPTLADVLELCRGRVGVVIELKYFGRDERLEERVVDVVEAARMESQVVVMSLNHDGIRKIRTLRPEWRVGLITAVAVGNLTTVDADFLAVNRNLATPLFIRDAHAAGKDVYVWPVYDRVEKARMISRGADGLITNAPAAGREMVTALMEMTRPERLAVDVALWIGMIPQTPMVQTNDLAGVTLAGSDEQR